MLLAAHPDDEALACSVILQRAVRAGAAVNIVYATDGDNNPWPQRILQRKWVLHASDRKNWGKLRRTEALAALQILGVHPSTAHFMGLPDQGLTQLLTTRCGPLLEQFAKSLSAWFPTDLLVPSMHDTHPDHSALAVMLQLVLNQLPPGQTSPSVWAYAVHGESKAFFDRAHKLPHSTTETSVKERAIRCHNTQLKLSRRRFLSYAARPEAFLKLSSCESTSVDGAIHSVSRESGVLRLELSVSTKLLPIREPVIFVLGHDAANCVRCLRVQVPATSSAVEMLDCDGGQRVGVAQCRVDRFAREFTIPVEIFSPAQALFVKLERRLLFFDEAGWIEIPPAVARTTVPTFIEEQCVSAEALN